VDYYLLALYAGLLLCVARLAWIKFHTSRRELFLVRKKLGNKNALYMRPSKCPVGDMAAARIFISLRNILRQLRAEGYDRIVFETHMVRKDNCEQFLNFLKSEGMVCENLAYRKTLLIHSLHLKIEMLIHHHINIKVHSESANICIRLQ
jgi:hypothetical protein